MNFHIIEHRSDEFWELVELRSEVLRRPIGLEYTRDQLEAETDVHHFALKLNEAWVGYCQAKKLDPQTVQFKQVAVRTDLQGKGIGKILMSHVEDWARKSQFQSAYLRAREYAIPFYERIGYASEGEPFEEVGIPHREMRKSLLLED